MQDQVNASLKPKREPWNKGKLPVASAQASKTQR